MKKIDSELQFVGYGFQVCSFWIVDTEETQELNAYLKKLGNRLRS